MGDTVISAREHDHGSFQVAEGTRAHFKPDLIAFIEENMLTRKNVELYSSADCTPEFQPTQALKDHFNRIVNDDEGAYTACMKLEASRWDGPINDGDPVNNRIWYPDSHFQNSGQIIENVALLPAHALKIPEAVYDFNAFVLLHEVGHEMDYTRRAAAGNPILLKAGIDTVNDDSFLEYNADKAAHYQYAAAHKRGLVQDPDVPDAFRAMRAMNEIQSYSTTRYGLTPLAGVDGIDIRDSKDATQARHQIHMAKTAIYKTIGTSLISTDERTEQEYLALRDTVAGPYPDALDKSVMQKIEQIETANYNRNPAQKYADMKDVITAARVPDSLKAGFEALRDDNLSDAIYHVGHQNARDPQLLYETTRQLQQKGVFDHDPVQNVFVNQFIRGAETYGVDYFGTDYRQTVKPTALAPQTHTSQPALQNLIQPG